MATTSDRYVAGLVGVGRPHRDDASTSTDSHGSRPSTPDRFNGQAAIDGEGEAPRHLGVRGREARVLGGAQDVGRRQVMAPSMQRAPRGSEAGAVRRRGARQWHCFGPRSQPRGLGAPGNDEESTSGRGSASGRRGERSLPTRSGWGVTPMACFFGIANEGTSRRVAGAGGVGGEGPGAGPGLPVTSGKEGGPESKPHSPVRETPR
mmetsp:Transcript_125118/g.361976  ORF Transcript_125118/g.361976 Transcript_125118/m.361976 type:complete len:206 (-) Transcript_125118:260-877(-)